MFFFFNFGSLEGFSNCNTKSKSCRRLTNLNSLKPKQSPLYIEDDINKTKNKLQMGTKHLQPISQTKDFL